MKLPVPAWLSAVASLLIGFAAPALWPDLSRPQLTGILLVGLLFACVCIAWATLRPTKPMQLDPGRRIADWGPIDRIDAFWLGQWAALIAGYRYPVDPEDNPGARPWADEFFFMKRAIQTGRFKVGSLPSSKTPGRKTLVTRAEITDFYESVGRRVPALFPDQR